MRRKFKLRLDLQLFSEDQQPIDTQPADVGGQDPADTGTPDQSQVGQFQQQQSPTQGGNQDSVFASMRRAMERQFQESPEYQLATRLAQYYGMDTKSLLQRLEQAEMQRQAQRMQVSPEFLQDYSQIKHRLEQLETERIQENFQRQLMDFRSKFPNVSDEELREAVNFLADAHRAGATHVTLEQAFRAVNPNYETLVRDRLRQELLQEMQQKQNNTPFVPNGTSPNQGARSAWDLSDEEFNKMIEAVKRGERIERF